jgi:hypothetical protein
MNFFTIRPIFLSLALHYLQILVLCDKMIIFLLLLLVLIMIEPLKTKILLDYLTSQIIN